MSKYYLSGQFVKDEGLVAGTDYNAINLQARFSTKLSDKVKIGVNFRPSYSRQKRNVIDFSDFGRNYAFFAPRHNQFSSDLTGQAVGSYAHARHFRNLDFTFIDENGVEQSFTQSSIWGTSNNNPAAKLFEDERTRFEYRLVADGKLDWKVAKNLNYQEISYIHHYVPVYFLLISLIMIYHIINDL